MITATALTVSQINTYVKSLIEGDMRLRRIVVTGEISNFTRHFRSGHLYFSLKDEQNALKCVMFAQSAARLWFDPENGTRVFVSGRLTVYERDGVYQLITDDMEPVGAGMMAAALEQLKQKLALEGLFDADRKRPIPAFPKRIGVVTSASGAAIRDIENVLARRFPLAVIVLCPAAVQGRECPQQNIEALESLAERGNVDVILLARGGGSQEDLWGYNDERLVRAVAACPVPVITGIGHEIDTSLCDLASDLRAPTPSAAAELATPDISEMLQAVDDLCARAYASVDNTLRTRIRDAQSLNARLIGQSPTRQLDRQYENIEHLRNRVVTAGNALLRTRQLELNALCARLKASDPTAILKQGRLTVLSGDDKLTSAAQVNPGDKLRILLVDGTVDCTADAVHMR